MQRSGQVALPAEVQQIEREHDEGKGGVNAVLLGGTIVAHAHQTEGGGQAEQQSNSVVPVKMIFQRSIRVFNLHKVEVNQVAQLAESSYGSQTDWKRKNKFRIVKRCHFASKVPKTATKSRDIEK